MAHFFVVNVGSVQDVVPLEQLEEPRCGVIP
ncbi:hypothetical protein C8R32_102270 [Nitrosospira sp. Nsp5]|uniref:Uncharacterized protein n=1 Tax=Nitrosospira multiformis TaxID=1231 RepID=A0ABY0TK13_9PROT|nr:hypothetical protein C8R32_102270 [Nitrosospira sp. Nsp5]SDQ95733.1 hypothetical protein SAMN05216402_2988 [Nitrosospira multiformis]